MSINNWYYLFMRWICIVYNIVIKYKGISWPKKKKKLPSWLIHQKRMPWPRCRIVFCIERRQTIRYLRDCLCTIARFEVCLLVTLRSLLSFTCQVQINGTYTIYICYNIQTLYMYLDYLLIVYLGSSKSWCTKSTYFILLVSLVKVIT